MEGSDSGHLPPQYLRQSTIDNRHPYPTSGIPLYLTSFLRVVAWPLPLFSLYSQGKKAYISLLSTDDAPLLPYDYSFPPVRERRGGSEQRRGDGDPASRTHGRDFTGDVRPGTGLTETGAGCSRRSTARRTGDGRRRGNGEITKNESSITKHDSRITNHESRDPPAQSSEQAGPASNIPLLAKTKRTNVPRQTRSLAQRCSSARSLAFRAKQETYCMDALSPPGHSATPTRTNPHPWPSSHRSARGIDPVIHRRLHGRIFQDPLPPSLVDRGTCRGLGVIDRRPHSCLA